MRPYNIMRLQLAVAGLLVPVTVGIAAIATRDVAFGLLVGLFAAPLALGFGGLRVVRYRLVGRAHEALQDLATRRDGVYTRAKGQRDLCRVQLDDTVLELCTTREYWAVEASAVDPWTRLTRTMAPRVLGATVTCREGEPLRVRWSDGETRGFVLEPATIEALTALEQLGGLPLQIEWEADGTTHLYIAGWVREADLLERLLDEGLPLAGRITGGLGGHITEE